MGDTRAALRRRHSGKDRVVPERLPVDPYFLMRFRLALKTFDTRGSLAHTQDSHYDG